MKVKCPNCDASLVFDATSGKMECKFCGSFFTMEEIAALEAREAQKAQEQAEKNQIVEPEKAVAPDYSENGAANAQPAEMTGENESDTMQCNVYICTSCGAELSVNGVETSTFCAYCGQPTIVFSRVSQELKPALIIPFRVRKDQAVAAIRNRFNQGAFIPKEVKNFEVERVRGIYIPYWLYDTYYYDKQMIKGTVGSGDNKKTKYFMREAECEFSNLTLDASGNLNDESSQRLEPFDMRDLRPFEVAYMSGFYADRYDKTSKDLENLALQRSKELFDGQMLASVNASSLSIEISKPKKEVRNATYALFPAWFMTFRYKDKPYTMLVNGQTGKLVGAVPFDQGKVKKRLITTFLAAALVCIPLCIAILSGMWGDEDFFKVVLGMIVGAVAMWGVGKASLRRIELNEKLTSSTQTNQFAHNRQSGGDYE